MRTSAVRRRLVTVLAVLALLGAGLVVSARPAYAFDLCKDAPPPMGPKSGMAGLVTQPPAQPVSGDPFTDPGLRIADVYGYTWSWTLYDLGCTPDALADPQAVFNTAQANLIMSYANTGMALLGLLERFAKDSGIGWFTTWVGQVAAAIQPLIFGGSTGSGIMVGLFPMACLALAVWLVWRARKARYRDTLHAVIMVVVCVGLASWTLIFPTAASATVDAGIRQVAAVSGGAFNASLADGANRQALYRSWLAGQFGDPDSQLAKSYGPRVMAATHYTWTEWAQIEQNPAVRQEIDERKAADYKQVAEEVKRTNPGAYLTFQGRGDRIGTAMFGLLVGFIMSIFALTAYFLILLGRAMMQILVVITPVAAVIGLLPPGYGALMRLWDLFAASVWAVAKFTFGAGLMATILGVLATLDPVSAVLWMTVVSVIGFMVLRPGREFKRLVPGLDPNRHYVREGVEKIATVAASVATGGAAGAAAGAAAAAGARESAGEPGRQWVDLQTPPSPSMATPQWVQIPGTRRHLALDPSPALGATTVGPAGPGRWEGILAAPLALPPGSTQAAGADAAERGSASRGPAVEEEVAGSPDSRPVPVPGPEVITVRQHPPAAVQPGAVVLQGVLVDDTTTYRRPADREVDVVDAEMVDLVDVSGHRDRGTDQPSHELMLYRSGRTA